VFCVAHTDGKRITPIFDPRSLAAKNISPSSGAAFRFYCCLAGSSMGLQLRRPDERHSSALRASIIALASQIPPPTSTTLVGLSVTRVSINAIINLHVKPALLPSRAGLFDNPRRARPFREDNDMKLYMHPVSMTSRPVRLFMAEKGLKADEEVVDLMTGAHFQEPYASLNPNKLVPMLDDDGFKLTESSAILKYLAEKFDLPEYPKDLKKRAKVNEVMDWLNTNFYREWAYGLCYPQLFPHMKRRSDEAHAATIEWGKEQSKRWLQVLNDHYIGPKNQYLTGDTITIADYFGAALVTLGELIGCDLAAYPNITRWLDNMKKLKTWPQVNEVFDGFKAQLKDQKFVTL
jgi:glutathione S-transferase